MPKVLDPTLLFFAFGMFAGLVRSNLEIPAQASKMLAQLLLIALGLKGGFALAHSGFGPEVLAGLGCALFLATAIPVLGYLSLRRLLPRFEAIALAASFGSVSAVAFIAATQRLEDAGIACAYLDGKTQRRAEVIAGFKAGAAPVFLVSLKSGGFGLNLTEADYCILLDPWWNPAAEAQAIDRTHRIGQTRPVIAYRLLAAGTVEEKIRALQKDKAALAAAVVQEESLASILDLDSLRSILE